MFFILSYWDSGSAGTPTPTPTPTPFIEQAGSGGRGKPIRTRITTRGLELKPHDDDEIMELVSMLLSSRSIQ